MWDFILLDPEWKQRLIIFIISLLCYLMSCGIQFKDNHLVTLFKSSWGSCIGEKTNVCDTQSQGGGWVNRKSGFSNLHHCPGPDPNLLSPTGKENQSILPHITREATLLCEIPINFAEVFCHHHSPGRQLSQSIRAERGWQHNCGRAPGSARSSTCRLLKQECPLSRHSLARGFRNHFVSVPFTDSTLEGSLSSKSRTETFASHLPAPIWWPFKNPSLL